LLKASNKLIRQLIQGGISLAATYIARPTPQKWSPPRCSCAAGRDDHGLLRIVVLLGRLVGQIFIRSILDIGRRNVPSAVEKCQGFPCGHSNLQTQTTTTAPVLSKTKR
jgi:hypothetical protein